MDTVQSDAKTVLEYLNALPDDRRAAIEKVRKIILQNLPVGYVEEMNWGMIAYEVPLSIYPKTYNGKPLMYAALASQKNNMAVYLCSLQKVAGAEAKFAEAWKKAGLKLDMGKSCLRFKRVKDLDLALVGEAIALMQVADFVKAMGR